LGGLVSGDNKDLPTFFTPASNGHDSLKKKLTINLDASTSLYAFVDCTKNY
jgi:hypothetical protein